MRVADPEKACLGSGALAPVLTEPAQAGRLIRFIRALLQLLCRGCARLHCRHPCTGSSAAAALSALAHTPSASHTACACGEHAHRHFRALPSECYRETPTEVGAKMCRSGNSKACMLRADGSSRFGVMQFARHCCTSQVQCLEAANNILCGAFRSRRSMTLRSWGCAGGEGDGMILTIRRNSVYMPSSLACLLLVGFGRWAFESGCFGHGSATEAVLLSANSMDSTFQYQCTQTIVMLEQCYKDYRLQGNGKRQIQQMDIPDPDLRSIRSMRLMMCHSPATGR